MKLQWLIVGTLASCLSVPALADVNTKRGAKSFEAPNGNTVQVRGIRQSDGAGNARGARTYRVVNPDGNVLARGHARGRKSADGSYQHKRVHQRVGANGSRHTTKRIRKSGS